MKTGIDFRELAAAQHAKCGAKSALEAAAEFDYPQNSGAFRIHPRRKRCSIASEPER
jgi:hypothetical protein